MRLRTLVIGSLLIAACGDDDAATPAPGPAPTTPTSTSTTPLPPPAPVVTAPKITTAPALPPLIAGAAGSLPIVAIGTAPIVFSITAGLAPGGTVLSTDGVLSGTPLETGTFHFTVTATNSAGTDSVPFTLDVVAPPPDGALLFTTNRLAGFSTAFPSASSAPVAITGVDAGDTIFAIDRRLENGYLYGFALNAANQVSVYAIHPETKAAFRTLATPVTVATPPADTAFDIDFSPQADVMRVVGNAGTNLRIGLTSTNVVVDTALTGAKVGATATGTAYTNNALGAPLTTQYTLAGTSLYLQAGNSGVLSSPIVIADVESTLGLDLSSSVNAPAANKPVAAGSGFSIVKLTGQAGLKFASIDLVTGKATALGDLPGAIRSFALMPTAEPRSVFGLSKDGTTLMAFLENTPVTAKSITIAGIEPGETLVGIDLRPTTGELLGFGVKSGGTTGSLYRINMATGASVAIAANAVTFVSKAGTTMTFPAPATNRYGFDINPATDRIRVVTTTGLNFRLNPNNGAPVDGDVGDATPVAGTNMDKDLAIVGGLSEVAFTNDAPAAPPGITTQYVIDPQGKALHLSTAPNAGDLGPAIPIQLNGAPLDFGLVAGFDIPRSVATTANNTAPAAGTGYAALTVGGSTGLYKIDLLTGAATLVSAIGDGKTEIGSLTVGN